MKLLGNDGLGGSKRQYNQGSHLPQSMDPLVIHGWDAVVANTVLNKQLLSADTVLLLQGLITQMRFLGSQLCHCLTARIPSQGAKHTVTAICSDTEVCTFDLKECSR